MWRASGGEWLTDRALGTPVGVVRRVVGLVQALDGLGAGLDALSTAQGVGLLAERAAAMGLPPSGRVSAGGATRLLRCADGWLALTLARDEDRALLPAWLEDDVPADPDDPDRVWAVVADQVGERGVTGLRDRGTLLGLPAAVVGEMRDVEPVRVERVGEASPRPLDGAVVVNLASLWAGPLCADVLARLGARVIKVESTGRPDGGRRARRFFEALHGGCDSVALDLRRGAGRSDLARLLRAADVVIEGSRPRALEQMGIDASAMTGVGPQVWLSLTGHGRWGTAASRVGFGDDAAAAGGLVGWIDGEPRFVADAVADPLTGLTSALAVSTLLERGGRWIADVALARVARSIAGEWAPSAGSGNPVRPAVRTDPGAPLPLGRDTDRLLRELNRSPV